MRNFEEFTGRSTPASSKTMRIAIQRRGTMSFNKATFEALGKPDAIILLFDKETRAVGIKATSQDTKHAYPVRKQPNSNSFLVAAQAFCKYYDIDTEATRAYYPQLEDGMIVFELDKGAEIPTRRRTEQ